MVSPYSAARHTTYRCDVAAPVRYFASEEGWYGRAENYGGVLDLTFASSNRDALRSERQICSTNVTR
jgi:hypothetical protein